MKMLLAIVPAYTKAPLSIRQTKKENNYLNFLQNLVSYKVHPRSDFNFLYPKDKNSYGDLIKKIYDNRSPYVHVMIFKNIPDDELDPRPRRSSYETLVRNSFTKMMKKHGLNNNTYTKFYKPEETTLIGI